MIKNFYYIILTIYPYFYSLLETIYKMFNYFSNNIVEYSKYPFECLRSSIKNSIVSLPFSSIENFYSLCDFINAVLSFVWSVCVKIFNYVTMFIKFC